MLGSNTGLSVAGTEGASVTGVTGVTAGTSPGTALHGSSSSKQVCMTGHSSSVPSKHGVAVAQLSRASSGLKPQYLYIKRLSRLIVSCEVAVEVPPTVGPLVEVSSTLEGDVPGVAVAAQTMPVKHYNSNILQEDTNKTR